MTSSLEKLNLFARLYQEERPFLRQGKTFSPPEFQDKALLLEYRHWRSQTKDLPNLESRYLAPARKLWACRKAAAQVQEKMPDR